MHAEVMAKVLRGLVMASVCSLIFISSGCMNQESDRSTDETEAIQPLTKHWEQAIPFQETPEGLQSLSASECGECHEQIHREWRASNHAIALQDPQFQAEWAKDEHLWVCLNCHTPLQNQQEFIVTGKLGGDYFKPVQQANPNFDPALKEESITCAVCHVRDRAVIGVRGISDEAPHAVTRAPENLSRDFCLGCHNVTDELTPTLVCSFQTGEEWQASPYPQAGRDCISCHMPAVFRPLAAGGPARWTRRHTWIGSAIPKFPGGPDIVKGYQSGLAVHVQKSQESYTPGDSAFFTVSLTNQNAGHDLPTGDPEYFITLALRVVDDHNRSLQDTTFRIGQEWEWWPEARKLADNRLKPLEKRNYSFACKIQTAPQYLNFEVVVTSHRMTEKNAGAMGLSGEYPLNAVIYQRRISLGNEK